MGFLITVHYDNASGFQTPYLWIWYAGVDTPDEFAPTGSDIFGFLYAVEVKRNTFGFKFKDGPGTAGPWEDQSLDGRKSGGRPHSAGVEVAPQSICL